MAEAIKQELDSFLQRLPACANSLSVMEAHSFLQRVVVGCKGKRSRGWGTSFSPRVALRHKERGVAAALALVDERMLQLKEPSPFPRPVGAGGVVSAGRHEFAGLSALSISMARGKPPGLGAVGTGIGQPLGTSCGLVVEMNH